MSQEQYSKDPKQFHSILGDIQMNINRTQRDDVIVGVQKRDNAITRAKRCEWKRSVTKGDINHVIMMDTKLK